MGYTLNGTALTSFSISPGQSPDSNLALQGFLSMPERMHKTEHSWGDQKGIEPYVSSPELYWGGRNLVFHGIMRASSRDDAHDRLEALYAFIDDQDDLMTLASPYGTWQVYVNGQIEAVYHSDGVCKLQIPFRQPVVDLTGGSIPSSNDWGQVSGIDGVDFEALGFTLVNFNQNDIRGNRLEGQLHRPAPKSGESIGYLHEPYQVTKSGAREIGLKAVIVKPSYAALLQTVQNLYALFAQPGTRVLYIPEDRIRIVYARKGFEVSRILGGQRWTAQLEIKLTEAMEYQENETYLFLGDTLGRYVTTTQGQKILIKL
ncbi:MAG: hypothetical protein ACXIUD_09815 [Mongoliitalea sp.]